MKLNSKKSQALVRAGLVLGILVLVNLISIRIFGRMDLTDQKVFTLSDASKDLVGNLDDRVTVRAYFTEDLPAPYNGNRRAVLDILNEYKAYGEGNFQFEFINPAGEEGEQEAQQQGIMPVQVQVVKNDKMEVVRGYLGLTMLYEDRKETIPVIQNLSSLEYDISSTLKRLVTRTKKRIGYTTGNNEPGLNQLSQVSQVLSGQYDLVAVDLAAHESVPQDIDVLLVLPPSRKLSDSALAVIDDFIMRGGKAGFFINKVNASLQGRPGQPNFAQPQDLGIGTMLEGYGVRINGDLVRDAQCANISVRQQQGPFMVQSQIPFPFIPLASHFDKENMIVKDLQSIIFYFVSSLDTSLASGKGVHAQVLIQSSGQSGRQSGFIMIDPFQELQESDFSEDGIPLAVLLEGSFASASPLRTGGDDPVKSPDTRIIVVGDGDFMNDSYLGNRGNVTFFANIVDYLADDAGLITIRSKNISAPPLEQVSDEAKRLLKYTDLLLPPFIIIIYGLVRWRRRLSMKKALEETAS